MNKKALEDELKLLNEMAGVCQMKDIDVLERYASKQFDACVEGVFLVSKADPSVHLADCQFIRGQGYVWKSILNMRKGVEARTAKVGQELEARRKEE